MIKHITGIYIKKKNFNNKMKINKKLLCWALNSNHSLTCNIIIHILFVFVWIQLNIG